MKQSDVTTEGIRVRVSSYYLPKLSDPRLRRFLFAYHVVISNEGESPARLVERHWIITDGFGRRKEVVGPGVVGQTPRLEPGEHFKYTSSCPLPTEIGVMAGTYRMVRDDGREFLAQVGPFTLARPDALH
ncbi:MAG: Co2+/Mg2+ efflux protein ApaG [Deltaproteobacteria bacterium]|nr:MAG: Co2+/Mg2+ efflux protein ApaG [Deltaproteobacteria bacterium]